MKKVIFKLSILKRSLNGTSSDSSFNLCHNVELELYEVCPNN